MGGAIIVGVIVLLAAVTVWKGCSSNGRGGKSCPGCGSGHCGCDCCG